MERSDKALAKEDVLHSGLLQKLPRVFAENASLPTPELEVNVMLLELLQGVRTILGERFVGLYLDGSLALGDFDEDSDVDFVVVTEEEVPHSHFLDLQSMHDRIATLDYWCATQLEGSYISRNALRHYKADNMAHPNIERGCGERLKMELHNHTWIVHRYVLREAGITVVGPDLQTLIDPVSPDDLRQAMRALLGQEWANKILDDPHTIKQWGYQTYVVLSLCRALYTLEHGVVASKPAAARWAQETLGSEWDSLFERVWKGRHNPGKEAPIEDIKKTLDFIRYALDRSQPFMVEAV